MFPFERLETDRVFTDVGETVAIMARFSFDSLRFFVVPEGLRCHRGRPSSSWCPGGHRRHHGRIPCIVESRRSPSPSWPADSIMAPRWSPSPSWPVPLSQTSFGFRRVPGGSPSPSWPVSLSQGGHRRHHGRLPFARRTRRRRGITVAIMASSPSRRTSRRPEEGDVPVGTAEAVDHVMSLLPTTSFQKTAPFQSR